MKKILVIEDELRVRNNILEILEFEQFDAVSAENGLIGALWAQEYLPDLVICDVMMPEINGYEVLSALRQNPMTATIPFIFLTAMADKPDRRRGMELGADDYLTKPFTADELLTAISARFAQHKVVMQQYNNERQKTEALQQKVQQLQHHIDTNNELLKQFPQELLNVIPKLNMANYLLKDLPAGTQRERCLKILQHLCKEEITLLNQMPNLQNVLTPENFNILRQFHIVSGATEK